MEHAESQVVGKEATEATLPTSSMEIQAQVRATMVVLDLHPSACLLASVALVACHHR